MDIKISPQTHLQEVAEAFHHKFPGLKIEFFREEHAPGMPAPKSHKLDPHLTFSEVSNLDHAGAFHLDGHMKVQTFEQNFQQRFGFGVQVFRKSSHAWILTTKTDDWTLSHQNQEGLADNAQ